MPQAQPSGGKIGERGLRTESYRGWVRSAWLGSSAGD
jgi:hypothetical protein